MAKASSQNVLACRADAGDLERGKEREKPRLSDQASKVGKQAGKQAGREVR
jgi:hypothetical protein